MEKCMNYDRALDFLLYSYFEFDGGIDGIQSGDDMKMCCAQRAYRDLARTVEYNYSTSMLDYMIKESGVKKAEAKEFKDSKNKLIENVCVSILKQIKKMSDSGMHDQKAFNGWHEEICKYIISLMKAEKSEKYDYEIVESFTYGQAQKWLNMTLKYFWLFNLLPAGLDEKLLHVPVDSYIIEATWKDTQIKIPVKNKNKDRGKYNSEKVKTWSKWEKTDYTDFQDSLKIILGNKKPLEWEAETWVKQSEIRKKNEKQAKRDTFFKENNPL